MSKKKRKNPVRNALDVVEKLIGGPLANENTAARERYESARAEESGKDPAAVSLGRRGGLKGGPARVRNMTPEQLSESARKAARARWGRVKKKP